MYISLDIETTGFDKEKNKIIEIAAIKFDENKIYETFDKLINPKQKIPIQVSHLTGITDEALQKAPCFEEIQNEFQNFIGTMPIIGHNIKFDIDFLTSNGIIFTNEMYDTYTLSRMLLPYQDSYSLEILTQALNIEHQTKHRALQDTKATADLFRLLLKNIEAMPNHIFKTIQEISQKNPWREAKLFQKKYIVEIPSQNNKNIVQKTPHKSAFEKKSYKDPELTKLIQKNIREKNTSIIEAECYDIKDQLVDMPNEKILIATQKTTLSQENTFQKLYEPNQYLCLKKLATFRKKLYFNEQEICLLIKILLRKDILQTGTAEEIDLIPEEYAIWNQLAADENHCKECQEKECYYKKALQNAKNAQHVFIPHALLLEPAILPTIENLIIDDTDILLRDTPHRLTQTFHTKMFSDTPEEIFTKIEILFGLLGMIYEKYAENEYTQVIINEQITNSKDWKQIIMTLENILSLSKKAQESDKNYHFEIKKLENLKKTCINTIENFTWINYWGEITIKSAPKKIYEPLINALNQFQSKIFLSRSLSVNQNFDFIKKLLSLPNETTQVILKNASEKLPLYIISDIAPPNNPSHFKESINICKTIIEKERGKIFILHTAKKSLEDAYAALIHKETTILCQTISGGTGKILNQYFNNPDKTVIIGTPYLLEKIAAQKKDPEAFPQTLIIQKIPFSSPTDPFTKLESLGFKNEFEEYTIPKAALQCKRIIHTFTQNEIARKKIILLDSRLHEKPYMQSILSSLPSFIEAIAMKLPALTHRMSV